MTRLVRPQPARGWFWMLFLSVVGALSLAASVFPCVAAQPPAAEQPPANAEPAPDETPETPETPPASNKTYSPPLPFDPNQRNLAAQIKQIIRNGAFGPGEEEILTKFVKTYLLPMWMQPQSAGSKTSLVALRGELQRQYLWLGKGAPHDLLNTLALKFMTFVAKGNYPEPLRVNAMLMIGELNEVEPVPYGTVPHPLREAAPALIAAVAADSKQIDAVKVAAWVGILRHLRLNGITVPETRGPVRDAALQIVKTAGPPQGESAAAYTWIRAQAAEVLGELGDTGASGSTAAALAAVVADSKSSSADRAGFGPRCAAARALGSLNYQAGAVPNPAQIATALGQLALDACAAEDGQAFSRRRLKDRVSAVMTGLTGPPGQDDPQHKGIEPLMTDPASQKLLGELKPILDEMIKILDDKSTEDIDKLAQPRAKLQKLLKK